MATLTTHRTPCRVRDLPSDFPQVPVRDEEGSIDANQEAKAFLNSLNRAVSEGDWKSFGDLFADHCWWKDSLTLTFDKRTIRGRSEIVSAWQKLAAQRRPHDFRLSDDRTEMVQMQPAFVRLAPELATLDIPFQFNISNPDCLCVGVAKVIPSSSGWKIWIVATGLNSLTEHPFRPLPRATTPTDTIPPEQRGKAAPQGLPTVDGPLDAVVVGGGCSGLANLIMLDSIGANVACFDMGQSPGAIWTQRYKAVRLHHNNFMIQLPRYPVPADVASKYLSGVEVAQYMSRAVQDLALPFFGGIKVVSNVFDRDRRLWNVKIQDVATEQTTTVQARNLVLSNGFLVRDANPTIPEGLQGRKGFAGPVQHTSQYTTAEPYRGKDVIIVGSGNSAHDVAKDLAVDGSVGSVTILQRSPTALFDFETIDGFAAARYQGNIPVDTADFLNGMIPTGILRDMADGGIGALVQKSEGLYRKLEEKGYQVNRKPELMVVSLEQRGRDFFFDAPGVFDLVLHDRIKIVPGGAIGFSKDGLVVKDAKTGEERSMAAGGVVLATGYADADLPKVWADSGFLDAESAAQIENMGVPGVDVEGELIGQITRSGHSQLYFGGLGFAAARPYARYIAIQIMADKLGQTPDGLSPQN